MFLYKIKADLYMVRCHMKLVLSSNQTIALPIGCTQIEFMITLYDTI